MRAPFACTLALALCSLSLSVAAKPVAEPISWNMDGCDPPFAGSACMNTFTHARTPS